jgi:hypothetical protein
MNWAGYVQLVVIEPDQFAQDIVATEDPLLSVPPSPLYKASFVEAVSDLRKVRHPDDGPSVNPWNGKKAPVWSKSRLSLCVEKNSRLRQVWGRAEQIRHDHRRNCLNAYFWLLSERT